MPAVVWLPAAEQEHEEYQLHDQHAIKPANVDSSHNHPSPSWSISLLLLGSLPLLLICVVGTISIGRVCYVLCRTFWHLMLVSLCNSVCRMQRKLMLVRHEHQTLRVERRGHNAGKGSKRRQHVKSWPVVLEGHRSLMGTARARGHLLGWMERGVLWGREHRVMRGMCMCMCLVHVGRTCMHMVR